MPETPGRLSKVFADSDFVFVRHDSAIFEQVRMALAAPSGLYAAAAQRDEEGL
ncbi:MAG: hypothetical protein IKQ37_10625 [Bacteroidaceae bacterium]|nr:hypothetical protein [Bacteroidaceae bacterium]